MRAYKLQSSGLVCAPGVVAWAINGAEFRKDRKLMIDVIAKTWKLPYDVAEALVLKKVPYTVDDDECVKFTIPNSTK